MRGDNLMRHIKAVRRKIKKELGITVFSVLSKAFRMRVFTMVNQDV